MLRSNSSDSESNLFLEPPHSHNPTDVSHICALPSSMMNQLPESIQDALWSLQESTSVIYASYARLQTLVEERFDRLIPLSAARTKSRTFSEEAFFNYVNHLNAERRYLLDDAYPDWKHKASRTGLNNYQDLKLTFRGRQMTVGEWFSQLQTAISYWCDEAQHTELPDFESTVLEFESQSSTPTSEHLDARFENTMDQRPIAAAHEPVNADGLRQHMSKALEAF